MVQLWDFLGNAKMSFCVRASHFVDDGIHLELVGNGLFHVPRSDLD